MEFVKGEKINYRLFKTILNIVVIMMAGYVFCDVAYLQIKYIYYCKNGVKNIAQTYKENNRIILEYVVDGETYLNDITDEISPRKSEEIYFLKQQPEKYYRVAYKETIFYGYLFICVLLILRFILIAIVKHMPVNIFYGKRFAFEKEIINFHRKKK